MKDMCDEPGKDGKPDQSIDPGATVDKLPTDATIIGWAKAKLKITAERHESQQYEQVESFKAEKARSYASELVFSKRVSWYVSKPVGSQGSSHGGELQGGEGCNRLYAKAVTTCIGGGSNPMFHVPCSMSHVRVHVHVHAHVHAHVHVPCMQARAGKLALEIETMQKSRKAMVEEHEARLVKD